MQCKGTTDTNNGRCDVPTEEDKKQLKKTKTRKTRMTQTNERSMEMEIQIKRVRGEEDEEAIHTKMNKVRNP